MTRLSSRNLEICKSPNDITELPRPLTMHSPAHRYTGTELSAAFFFEALNFVGRHVRAPGQISAVEAQGS
jgi:hypothetical protein